MSNVSFKLGLGPGAATPVMVDLVTTASTSSIGIGDAMEWASVASLVNSTNTSSAAGGGDIRDGALPVPGASLWLQASSIQLSNGSPVAAWLDKSGSGCDVFQVC